MKYKFKILLLCVSVSALTNCSINRNIKTTKQEDVVVKVKSIQVLPYEALENSGKIEKGERHNMITNTVETFNEEGITIELKAYHPSGGLYYSYTYKYNETGKKIEDNRNSGSKTIYEYDDEGNMIGDIYYNSDGSQGSKSIYKYNDKGNIIEKEMYLTKGDKYTYKYDGKGDMISQAYYNVDGSQGSKRIYKYDDKGNMIEQKNYRADGSLGPVTKVINHNYTFDEFGNWTEKITIKDGKPAFIIERQIEYFK